MSYSRWGSGTGTSYTRECSGHWYAYWRVQPNKIKETEDNALFEICGVCSFTAKQLRDDTEKCIDIVASKDITANKKLLNELKICINKFLFDVKRKYSLTI